MKYYKNTQNQIFAYESDGSQDSFIKSNLIAISQADADLIINPPKTLAELKLLKEREIKEKFEIESNGQVSALGFNWNGGFDSAIKLDAAMRLSQAASQPSIVFFDIGNVPHLLGYSDALTVVISVAGAYQVCLAKKQDLFVKISKSTLSNINTITW